MKKIILAIGLLTSIQTFAGCNILIGNGVSNPAFDLLLKHLPGSKISRFMQNGDFGIKGKDRSVDTGKKNPFGESIIITESMLQLYEKGQVIFETSYKESSEKNARELVTQLETLRCD